MGGQPSRLRIIQKKKTQYVATICRCTKKTSNRDKSRLGLGRKDHALQHSNILLLGLEKETIRFHVKKEGSIPISIKPAQLRK